MDPMLQFLFFGGLAIFFTGLAWNRQTPVPFFLAGVVWLSFGLLNMAAAPDSIWSAPLSWICLGVGLILILRGIWLVLRMLTGKGGIE